MSASPPRANIEFLKKGPWYLLHDVESMKLLLQEASAVVSALNPKNIGIVGDCRTSMINSNYDENKKALGLKLNNVISNASVPMWQLQYLTFCCIFLLDKVKECLKQYSPQCVCRLFFDTFNENMRTKLFGDSASDGAVVALMPLELTTFLMIELSSAYGSDNSSKRQQEYNQSLHDVSNRV